MSEDFYVSLCEDVKNVVTLKEPQQKSSKRGSGDMTQLRCSLWPKTQAITGICALTQNFIITQNTSNFTVLDYNLQTVGSFSLPGVTNITVWSGNNDTITISSKNSDETFTIKTLFLPVTNHSFTKDIDTKPRDIKTNEQIYAIKLSTYEFLIGSYGHRDFRFDIRTIKNARSNSQMDTENNGMDTEYNRINTEDNGMDTKDNRMNTENNRMDTEDNGMDMAEEKISLIELNDQIILIGTTKGKLIVLDAMTLSEGPFITDYIHSSIRKPLSGMLSEVNSAFVLGNPFEQHMIITTNKLMPHKTFSGGILLGLASTPEGGILIVTSEQIYCLDNYCNIIADADPPAIAPANTFSSTFLINKTNEDNEAFVLFLSNYENKIYQIVLE